MTSREEAVKYLLEGYCPSIIAEKKRVSFKTIEQYLSWGIGDGLIRKSDIVYTINKKHRDMIESIIYKYNTEHWFAIDQELKEMGEYIDSDDLEIYLKYRKFVPIDIYEDLREIEINIHRLIRKKLNIEYDERWWRLGIPNQIKKRCIDKSGKPDYGENLYRHTSFRDLIKIIKQNPKIFSKTWFDKISIDRKNFLNELDKLIDIRNVVMHPVNMTEDIDDDYYFIKNFKEKYFSFIYEWLKNDN